MATRFELERISLILLMNCNLKCKNCCVQAPYYKKKYYPKLDFVKAEIDRLFEIADTINFFSIEGGEALLRKDFGDILSHLIKYKEQIGIEIPIITNGTIVPDIKTIESAKQLGDKVRFIIDNYGPLSSRIKEIAVLLEKENIRYTVRDYYDESYYGGWVDLYGKYEKKHDKSGAELLHSRCAWVQKLKGVMEVIGGMIYFCPASRVFFEHGVDTPENEIIRFMDEPIESVRYKLKRILETPSLAACQYCNGIHDDSVRYKPAIQLTEDELKQSYLSEYLYREVL